MLFDAHIILDLEFNPTMKPYRSRLRNEIIEIAAVKLDSQWREIDRFACLVRPEWNERIEPKITRLTGLTDADVKDAVPFEQALEQFSHWIGDGRVRLYSWSDSDLQQLDEECWAKEIDFPENMYRWLDLQRIYPRLMALPAQQQLSLKAAAFAADLAFDTSCAHRAMYDAQITAQLLQFIEFGTFRAFRARNKQVYAKRVERSTYSIGEACSSVLAQLLERMTQAEVQMG